MISKIVKAAFCQKYSNERNLFRDDNLLPFKIQTAEEEETFGSFPYAQLMLRQQESEII